MRATVLVALLAALLAAPRGSARGDAPDGNADSDPAAYLVVIEHENEWQCSASLISLRTAVTTATCARGGAGEQLWALAALLLGAAPAPPALLAAGARRVARVALAGDGRDPTDPALDLAVVELEAPFGAEAESRPIVMATLGGGCAEAPECHTLRSLAARGARRVRFRVGSVARAPPERCAARVPHWAASQHNLLCYTGNELCERDLGAGVVCDGRLCGALSAVAGAGEAGEAGGGRCGDTFAVQNITRWRHFLHCAHTLRLCGRRPCETVCSERRLLDDVDLSATVFTSVLNVSSDFISHVYSTTPPPRQHSPSAPGAEAGLYLTLGEEESAISTFRPSVEFEPNRADFKVTPSRTSRVGLKAGEYGDNAADYGGEEPAPAAPRPTRPARPARPTRTAPAAPARPAPAAPHAPALRAATTPVPSSGDYVLNSNCVCISFMTAIVHFVY